MFRRLFLVFLPSLTASTGFANEASWNCEQNKDSKEWVCVGEAQTKAKSSATPPPVKAAPPVLSEPAATPRPAVVQPAQVAEPIRRETPSEAVQPVQAVKPMSPAPVASPPPAKPESIQARPPVVAEPVQAAKQVNSMPVESTHPAPPVSRQAASHPEKLPSVEARGPGWLCDAADDSWNCQLVGPEPSGKNNMAAAGEPMSWLLKPAFDHQQEQTFGMLASRLPRDPWENCSVEPGIKRDFGSKAGPREVSPLDVKSNYAEVFDNEIGNYSGNVKMARADQQASANTANYDRVSETLELHGNVYYSEDELALYSDTATLKLATDQATLRDARFISPSTPLRGRASAVYRDSKTLSRYRDVAYTSCRPGNQDWVVHASELKMNKETGKGAAKNTWVEFKGVPVFYSPYLAFPIDNRRISGFLAPSFGRTQNSGFNISAPYYWNIAPNYDATLMPRYLTKRGPLLAGNMRYLGERTSGSTSLEFMPNDSLTDKPRYLGSVKNTSGFASGVNSNVDINYVSDKKYFAELGNALSFPNFSYLKSSADMNYIKPGISLTGLVENYQAINTTIPDAALPYRKLPQINLNLDHAFKFMPLYTAMENEFVYFQHNDLVTSQRMNLKPSISFPLQTAGAFFTPKVALQYTQYFLSSGPAGTPDSISRTLPFLSADSGLFFERDVSIAQDSYVHTLEPRLFYLYVPYKNQQDIPLFDTAPYDFSYNAMFRDNSFSGIDRVQNANQVTTAVTSRLIDSKSGRDTLKLSVGEIFYFNNRDVTIPFNPVQINNLAVGQPGFPAQTGSFSNLVTELSSELTDRVAVETALQWNPVSSDIERGQAVLHYKSEANEVVNLGYLYRKNPRVPNRLNDVIQSDMSFRWPIYDNWYALGRWQYSLLYNKTQESFVGVEKENCCWRFRVIGRHYINNINNINNITGVNQVVEGTSQNGIFFQIELKGLTGIGEKLDAFFEQNLYGYRKPQQ
jgi:LPS-assembly protein